MTDAQREAERKQERLEYNVSAVINIVLMLASLGFFISTVVCVFKGNWPFTAGFALLTYCTWWVFRRVPWPETKLEKLSRELGIRRR